MERCWTWSMVSHSRLWLLGVW